MLTAACCNLLFLFRRRSAPRIHSLFAAFSLRFGREKFLLLYFNFINHNFTPPHWVLSIETAVFTEIFSPVLPRLLCGRCFLYAHPALCPAFMQNPLASFPAANYNVIIYL